ncbi:MAG: hypothetical protein O2856_20420, partial [Planctomycetota bacterium]|nr:hypothetical protein [Planctomycetota bacterium]
MSDNPREQDIQEAYAPALRFLKSISGTIAEAEDSSNSDSLELKAEQVEFEIETLKTPFPGLMHLRSHANSLLLTTDRLQRMRTLVNADDSNAAMDRVRRSNVATVEIVIILGESLVSWLRHLSVSHSPISDFDSDSDGDSSEFLEMFAKHFEKHEPRPPSENQIVECCAFLEEEKTLLVANLRNSQPSTVENSTMRETLTTAKQISSTFSEPNKQEPDSPGSNSLSFSSGSWILEFNGAVIVQSRLDGFFYIRELIAKPGKPITAIELRRRRRQFGNHSVKRDGSLEAGLNTQGNDLGVGADNRMLAETKSEIKKLRCEIADEERHDNNPSVLAELKQKLQVGIDYLKKSTNHRGEPRKQSNRQVADENNVRQRIDGAVEEIGKQDQDMK